MPKNSDAVMLSLIAIALWILLPTGDPTDFLITLPLISVFGGKAIVIAILALLILHDIFSGR